MTVWDTLTGKKSSSPPTSTETYTHDTHDTAPTTSFTSHSALSGPPSNSPFVLDAASLHPLANVNQDTLDYLTLEDSVITDLPGGRSALPSRGWSDDLCYGTGVTYLSALSFGGVWGLAEGWNKAPGTASSRLRLNYVLNAVTRRGPFLGNSAGVVAMVYNIFNSTIGYARGRHDSANSIVAGALSGMLFKSTRGVKPMMISGGIVAGAAGAWALTRKTFFDVPQNDE